MQLNNAHTYDPKSIKVLAYPSAKIAGALVLATMALLGVTPVGGTIAGFFNHEGTVANAFQAGTWETSPPLADTAPLELTLSSIEVVDAPPPEETPPAEQEQELLVTIGDPQVVDPPAENIPSPVEGEPQAGPASTE
jgi:hypothetical protein